MTEEANLKATYSPGKSGGTYGLPLGAKLFVPEGLCSKKDTITCRVAPPSQRWQHLPSFPGEYLTSEIYTLTGTVNMKRTVIIQLPYYQVTETMSDLNVKGKWKDEVTWVDVGFLKKDDEASPCVELEIDRLGSFVVTIKPRQEPFTLTPNGCLYNARINRHFSVRFPKRAVDTTINYTIQITPIPEDRVNFAKENFPMECADMLVVTEIVDVRPDVHCNFRRPATVKLPLPAGVEVEGDSADDIVVLHKLQGGWEWVEAKYKYTRCTVSFDVKNPSRFCVMKAKPGREKKMREAMTVLEERLGKENGQVGIFLSLKEKSWMAVVEAYPEMSSQVKVDSRQDKGFRFVKKVEVPNGVMNGKGAFSRRPPPPLKDFRAKEIDGFEMFDGLVWSVEVKDDIKVSDESDLGQNSELQYFKYLKESYRRFVIEPSSEEERDLRGTITLTPVGVEDAKTKEQLTMTFHIDIPEETVRDYFKPEPVPEEPEPEKPKLTFDLPALTPTPKVTAPPPSPIKYRTISSTVMDRLTKTIRRPRMQISLDPGRLYDKYRRIGFVRPPVMAEREAKVLTGRSLMTLSKVVSEGLTLAVHLDLPDSTITGIGFDAIANGMGMSDVTYKILLYWKRTCKDKRDGAVEKLIEALRGMGRHGVADIVQEQHRENKELTTDCFLLAAAAGTSLAQ